VALEQGLPQPVRKPPFTPNPRSLATTSIVLPMAHPMMMMMMMMMMLSSDDFSKLRM
jgi:hypothetical protein